MLIDWAQVPTARGMRAGSTRQAIAAHQLSAVRVTTSPDAEFDGRTHRHDNEQVLIMISGEVELIVDDERFTARDGDFVFFPPGSWHGAVGVGPEGAVYYELFAPPRFDQLSGWVGSSPLELR